MLNQRNQIFEQTKPFFIYKQLAQHNTYSVTALLKLIEIQVWYTVNHSNLIKTILFRTEIFFLLFFLINLNAWSYERSEWSMNTKYYYVFILHWYAIVKENACLAS